MDRINDLYQVVPKGPQVEKLQQIQQNPEGGRQSGKQAEQGKRKKPDKVGTRPKAKARQAIHGGPDEPSEPQQDKQSSPEGDQGHYIDLFA